MKRNVILTMSVALLVSSCGTYEGAGAYAGAQFGSIIGSAIGGITGGWRGSDVGTLVGMAGGAAVGAAIGKAADNAQQRSYEESTTNRNRQTARTTRASGAYNDNGYGDYNESGFDPTNSGDDRIDFGAAAPPARHASTAPVMLEIRNARLVDASHDGVLTRGEEARMVFEIYNPTQQVAYNVLPMVVETTGNRHIFISENVLVESIGPKQTIRYTAMLKTDNRLRDGEASIRIGVMQNNKEITRQARVFTLPTRRR